MVLEVPIQPEMEARFRHEAADDGVAVEDLAARRIAEADLLWRIRSVAPSSETRELHRLLRKRRAGRLGEDEKAKLASMLDERENRAAQRLEDLTALSRLSRIPLKSLMDRLGISPIQGP